MLSELDLKNVLLLLQRGQYNGLADAEVAVVLAHKVRSILMALAKPPAPPAEKPNE